MSSFTLKSLPASVPLHFSPKTSTFLQANTHSYVLDAQTISICHASLPQPHSKHPKDCTKPNFASYPTTTVRTSTSPPYPVIIAIGPVDYLWIGLKSYLVCLFRLGLLALGIQGFSVKWGIEHPAKDHVVIQPKESILWCWRSAWDVITHAYS